MTNREMFERSFQRPKNFFELTPQEQWAIDKRLGILDWDGSDLEVEDHVRFMDHYDKYTGWREGRKPERSKPMP